MKIKFRLDRVLACMVFLMLLAGCRKNVPDGMLPSGQVALTFDDNNVNNWYSYLPLLDSLQIKATFYVCKYHHLGSSEKAKLRDIAARGHEIAFHTTSHPDLAKQLTSKTLSKVIYEEVSRDLDLMHQDGFFPENFAYPYGSHTNELDIALLRIFKTVRAASNKQNWGHCLAGHCGNRQILFGADIDECAGMSDESLAHILSLARDHKDCAVLTAHDINMPQHRYQVTLNRLRQIAKLASQLNLTFVTVHDIAD